MGLATIKSTGSAKNNLTVGAALADSATVTNSENIWLGVVSSRGPTDDHRLKPDLVASGSFQFPGYPTSNYGSSSAAAATVTGLLGQLNEINVDGNDPPFLASTWIALLLNTTIDGRNLNHFVATLSPQPLTRFYDQENKAKRFYRIRLATPLGSNLSQTLVELLPLIFTTCLPCAKICRRTIFSHHQRLAKAEIGAKVSPL
jgi:hypothetical protein